LRLSDYEIDSVTKKLYEEKEIRDRKKMHEFEKANKMTQIGFTQKHLPKKAEKIMELKRLVRFKKLFLILRHGVDKMLERDYKSEEFGVYDGSEFNEEDELKKSGLLNITGLILVNYCYYFFFIFSIKHVYY
jgi:hypothetical protein